MGKITIYKYLLLPVILIAMISCGKKSKTLNRMITLWRKDKIPYGTYFAYENMKYIFPDALISINKNSPVNFNSNYAVTGANNNTRRKAYIIIASRVVPDKSEINALMNFVAEGNQLFISSFHIGDSLLAYLHVKTQDSYDFSKGNDSLELSIYNPLNYDSSSFRYPGIALDSYVTAMDSQYTTILGRDAKGHPDFIKFGYKGGGAIFLHFAPAAFTNYFLLHKENKTYFENAFSYLSASVGEVKWDDYFRYAKRNDFSALQYILNNPPLRWAFWLLLLLFALIYLFESKRRQKLIPILQPLNNSSLDFVTTIGRLYYQQKDNGNLAVKMTTHFMDHVRTKYNLSTSVLNEDFIDRLSFKTGFGKEGLKGLVHDIRVFQENPSCTDDQLLALNKKMEAFYKQA